MTLIDMSLHNQALYNGCLVSHICGKAHLETPPEEAIPIVRVNAHDVFEELLRKGETTVLLSGAMTIWSYLIVAHVAEKYFDNVFYADASGAPLQIN